MRKHVISGLLALLFLLALPLSAAAHAGAGRSVRHSASAMNILNTRFFIWFAPFSLFFFVVVSAAPIRGAYTQKSRRLKQVRRRPYPCAGRTEKMNALLIRSVRTKIDIAGRARPECFTS